MSNRWPTEDQFDQVTELNRLFLTYLQGSASADLDQVGFPALARRLLLAAPRERLDTVASFPRALFELRLPVELDTVPRDPRSGRGESARQAMNVMIVHCAWTLSRQSVYQARLLLGLESRVIQQLRSLPLGGLHPLATAPSIVRCAFATREWLWQELLSADHAEARQRLALVALQPGLERDWPVRRPVTV
jgi:hypothetical protein